MGSEISVPRQDGSGNVTLKNNESWGMDSSFTLDGPGGLLVSPLSRTAWPQWTSPSSTPLLFSWTSGDQWSQSGSVICSTNYTHDTCGLTPNIQTGPSTVRSVWNGQVFPCQGPTCTKQYTHKKKLEADRVLAVNGDRSASELHVHVPASDVSSTPAHAGSNEPAPEYTDWRLYWSGPVLEFTASVEKNLEVKSIERNVTWSGLPYRTHANCYFDPKGYSYMARERTGMKLTSCAAISLPDGTFIATATVCWDDTITVAAYGDVSPASLVAFTSKDGYDWLFSSIIANASWYTGPPEKPPPYPTDPIRPGVTTSGGWINQTIQFGPSENDLVLLGDSKTLMSVIRMDANDRCGNARHSGVWPPGTDTAY